MPKNMSFSFTTEQIRNRTKTVTRRLGWKDLRPGTILTACEKCMGLKLGEKVKKICRIRVISVSREHLHDLTQEEIDKEGYPGMSPPEFVEKITKSNRKNYIDYVTRIEFEYV